MSCNEILNVVHQLHKTSSTRKRKRFCKKKLTSIGGVVRTLLKDFSEIPPVCRKRSTNMSKCFLCVFAPMRIILEEYKS